MIYVFAIAISFLIWLEIPQEQADYTPTIISRKDLDCIFEDIREGDYELVPSEAIVAQTNASGQPRRRRTLTVSDVIRDEVAKYGQ